MQEDLSEVQAPPYSAASGGNDLTGKMCKKLW